METVRQALLWADKELSKADIQGPGLDAEVLLTYVTGLDRLNLYRDPDQVLSAEIQSAYRDLIIERCGGKPVAYIIGQKEFMSLDFTVNSNVLIPRPETEIIVEWVIDKVKKNPGKNDNPVILDIGTGSGAIAVSLARYLPQAGIMAIDISSGALEVARMNAAKNAVGDRVAFLKSNLLEDVPIELNGKGTFVVANLPYIPSADIPGLQREVAVFEPRLALDGGVDGLELYRKLIPQAWEILRPGGWLGMEIGMDQAALLTPMLSAGGWGNLQVLKDYAELDRFVVAKKILRKKAE